MPIVSDMRLPLIILTLFFANLAWAAPGLHVADSVGMERENGKLYILHKVEPKETLYAISRRYNVDVAAIKIVNANVESGLMVGQIVKIPVAERRPVQPETTAANVHVVGEKETLYSISKKYNTTVDNLKKWNNLVGNDVLMGQALAIAEAGRLKASPKSTTPTDPVTPTPAAHFHTVKTGETQYSIAKKYGITVDDLRQLNDLGNTDIHIGQNLQVANATAKQIDYSEVNFGPEDREDDTDAPRDFTKTKADEDIVLLVSPDKEKDEFFTREDAGVKEQGGFKKVVENGLAEVIDQASDTDKYLALHRTAPAGTIMQVKNEMNGMSVFVRIIGKLPDTGVNDKVIIKISKKTHLALAAVDRRFPVIVSYIP